MCLKISAVNRYQKSKYAGHTVRQQLGLGLPATLFVLVVLALLAIAITELETTSAQSTSLSMQSTRAFYAAESGAQAGLTRLFDFVDPAVPANPATCIAGFSLNFNVAGLQGCSAAVTCTMQRADMDDDANPESFFTIRSTGACGSGDAAALRSVEVRAR